MWIILKNLNEKHRYYFGGAGLSTDRIFSSIPSGNGGVIVHKALEKGLLNYCLETFNPNLSLIPSMLKVLRKKKYEVVHSSIELIGYLSYAQQRKVSTIHNYYLDEWYLTHCGYSRRFYYSNFLKRQFKLGLKVSDTIVSVSKTTYDLVLKDLNLSESVKRKIIVVRNGIDCDRFVLNTNPPNDRYCRILFVGNPSSRKGWLSILNIADNLPDNYRIMCTTGMRDIRSLPAHKNIEYIKRVEYEDMPSVYQQADMLLLPSFREGLSLAALEAMASGLPIVGFNASSMSELVVQEKGGILVEINDKDKLLSAVINLGKNAEQRKDYGLFNRERCINDFNVKDMVESYRNIFECS